MSLSPAELPLPRRFYLLPLLSAAILIPAFPPLEQGYLAWFALIPLLWFCLQAPPRQALAGGFLFALPLHLYLNLYLRGALFAHLAPAAAVAVLALLVAVTGLFYTAFAAAVSYARRRSRGLILALIIPSLWLLMEYARGFGFLGYNVGYLGYTQWRYPLVLNLAAVYGYWGLPFVMTAFQGIVLLGTARILRGKTLAAALSILAVLVFAGAALPELFPVEKAEKPLRAALIQGNSAPEEILSPGGKKVILERYLELTRRAAEKGESELAVWPETVVDLTFRSGVTHRPEMQSLAGETGLAVLYGARIRDGADLYNSILLLSPGDEAGPVYHKRRLVPFVEYFPLEEPLNRFLNLEIVLGSYTPGRDIVIFDLSGMPLAGVICFESYFGDYTRLFAARGCRHLFVLTNDAWFGKTIGLEQHAQVSAIRAAEMGCGVTQVANSGITVSFDYRGRELLRSGKSEREILALSLDLARRKTIYATSGDFFPAFWSIFVLGCGLAALGRNQAVKKRFKTP